MKTMDNTQFDHNNTFLTILTILLYGISHLFENVTISGVAGIAAILAAISTIVTNIRNWKKK